jgi:hypothetical protein
MIVAVEIPLHSFYQYPTCTSFDFWDVIKLPLQFLTSKAVDLGLSCFNSIYQAFYVPRETGLILTAIGQLILENINQRMAVTENPFF